SVSEGHPNPPLPVRFQGAAAHKDRVAPAHYAAGAWHRARRRKDHGRDAAGDARARPCDPHRAPPADDRAAAAAHRRSRALGARASTAHRRSRATGSRTAAPDELAGRPRRDLSAAPSADATHRPVNLGGRLSKKAATPSRWSSEAIASPCEEASASSAPPRSVATARLSICLSSLSARGGPAAIFAASARVAVSSRALATTRLTRPRRAASAASTTSPVKT